MRSFLRREPTQDLPEYEGSQGVELDGQQRGEVGGVVAVEELHALHEQRPEQLPPQRRQHLRNGKAICSFMQSGWTLAR